MGLQESELKALFKCAQMGKESCEHVLKYATGDKLTDLIHSHISTYHKKMAELEKLAHENNLEKPEIGALESLWFSGMINVELLFNNNNERIVKALVEGNEMGIKAMNKLLLKKDICNDTKKQANDILDFIAINIEELIAYKD